MNKRKAKKMRKKQDIFMTSFARSYKELREFDRAYHEFVIADRRSREEKEKCCDGGSYFFDDDFDEVI